MAMQVRTQHSHDGGIVERRLRPIYDWLDNGNNKKALQEAEKVLKKSPTLQAARALKALALFRLGRGVEAYAVLDALAAEKPSDDTTLQAMTITYRESQQLGKVCALYEAAVQMEPMNEELYSHLFMSYVRVGDPKSQQRTAMALYKIAPKNPYYFWAVMSIVLQAKTSSDSKQKGILLALAQRMVDNFIAENKMEAEQEARLYVMILELQEKWEDVVRFIESPLYSDLVPGAMPQASIPYLKRLGHWRRLNIICKDLLWESQDRWDYYLPYFDSVFQLTKVKSQESVNDNALETEENTHKTDDTSQKIDRSTQQIDGTKQQTDEPTPQVDLTTQKIDETVDKFDETGQKINESYENADEIDSDGMANETVDKSPECIDDSPEKCYEFLCHIMEEVTGLGKKLRGPYLARLELWKRISEDGQDPTALLGSGIGLCIEYLRAFGHKACAVPDLRPYLGMLSQKEREENCTEFLTCLGLNEHSEPETSDDIQRHVSCLTLWRLSAPPLDVPGNLLLAASLRRHYLRCLNKGLVTATLTEFCAADGYGVLAGHHYFYAAREQCSSAPLVDALSLLELVLHRSPANFHAKLLLITIYHLLGNALAADSIYQRLEVKHIQLVSLGWLHTARLAPAAAATRALQLLADTRAAHHHHAKDSVEHLTYAYKYGTFEKLVELYAWNARLEACAWSALAARERALWALLAGPPAPLHAPTRLPMLPTDNRDLNVVVNFEPPQHEDKDLKMRTFTHDLGYLRLKDGLLTCIALCIESAESKPIEVKTQQYVELKGCIEAFGIAMEKCKELYSGKEKISISTPFPSRIIAFVNSQVPYRDLYGTSLHMVAELSVGHLMPAHALCDRAAHVVDTARETFRKEISFGDSDPHWKMREVLECTANYLEFIGIITFLLGVCNELVTPANTKKSKKKANQSQDEITTGEKINKLNDTVQQSIAELEEIFNTLPSYEFRADFEENFAQLTLEDKYHSPVEQKLRNGQKDMITDMQNILKKKSKYLKTLLQ